MFELDIVDIGVLWCFDELFVQVVIGDCQVFELVYQLVFGCFFVICLYILCDCGDVEDVLQDVFVMVWYKVVQFDCVKVLVMIWFFMLVCNCVIDCLCVVLLCLLDDLLVVEEIFDFVLQLVQVVEYVFDCECLDDCLDMLEFCWCLLIWLVFLDGVSYDELVCWIGVLLGLVKSWICCGLG